MPRVRHGRARCTAVAAVLAVVLGAPAGLTAEAGAVIPPRGWPASVVLGAHDPEHGAAALRAEAPLGLRYHYLSGGVNTGAGWQAFAGGGGAFIGGYVADSQAHGFMTQFSYYMLVQSAPGSAQTDERLKTTVNLGSRATMTAYFEDLRTFFERAAATNIDPIVLHVEPDVWGYVQRSAARDDGRTVPAQVAATGLADLAGLPDDAAGFAQAIVRLRDRYAPNVLLGYHVSVWGTGNDISFSNPPDSEIDALAGRTAAFYRSLGAPFDVLHFEFADRDAGYREHVDGVGRAGWWDLGDFHRNQRYVGHVVRALDRPAVMWQIPLGNTRMRAMDNTPGHYQDNRVQTLLDPSQAELTRYRDAGVVGFLFGHALAGATCACDEARDGVTNPAPINGNDMVSLSADDDGGYFKEAVRQFVALAPLPAAITVPAPFPPPVVAAAAAADRPRPRFALRASARPRTVRRNRTVRISARVTSNASRRATVAVEIRGPGPAGRRQLRKRWPGRRFARATPRSFGLSWSVPRQARAGTYPVVVRITEPRRKPTARRATTIVVRR